MTADLAAVPVIGDMARVSLDELTEHAGLLTRVDRKYVMPVDDLPALLGGLPSRLLVLQIGGRREFGYRSVYFDTPDLASYFSTAYRRRGRYKVRTRSYLDSDQHVLEIKTRGPRGTTVKRRLPYTGTGDTLDLHASLLIEGALTNLGISRQETDLVESLRTWYRRSTLFDPAGGIRVTLDRELRWRRPDGSGRTAPERIIVETKSAGAASAVDRLLWSLGHRPVPMSKYGTGMAALRPDLPANHWKPVLKKHFSNLEGELS